MKSFFLITIDVEPDCSSTWHYSNPLTFEGVTHGLKNILQPLFDKYDTCPTYLINNVVLEDQRSIDTFIHLKGRYELGTHLHAEFIEPEKEYDNYAGQKGEANQCFLDPRVEFEKMKNITALFKSNFGYNPTSFRAGRFSAGVNTISCLEKLGYKADTSVTPHIVWKDKTREGVVDYSHAQNQPYFIKSGSYLEKGKGSILEIPVSIIKTKNWRLQSKNLWLRPFLSSYQDFVRVIKTSRRQHEIEDFQVFNMMFHNVEILPGLSRYCQTKRQCNSYLKSLEKFLIYCKKNNIVSMGMSDIADIYGSEKQ